MTTRIAYLSLCVFMAAFSAWGQGSAFTYQGRLTTAGAPATGAHDFRAALYDADFGGSAIGSVVTNLAVGLTDGYFVTELDFGAGVFTGARRWLELGVRQAGEATFSTR